MQIKNVFVFSLAAIAAAIEAEVIQPTGTSIDSSLVDNGEIEGPIVTGEVIFDDATNEYVYNEGDFEGNTEEDLANYFADDYQGDANSEKPQDICKLIEHIKEKKCPKKKCMQKLVKTKTCIVTVTKRLTKTVPKKCAPTNKSKAERCPQCGSPSCDSGNDCDSMKKGMNNKKSSSKKGSKKSPKNNKNSKAERCPDCGSTDCGGSNGDDCDNKNQDDDSACPNCGSNHCDGDC